MAMKGLMAKGLVLTRRWMMVLITPELVAEALMLGPVGEAPGVAVPSFVAIRCEKGLPVGTRFVGVRWLPEQDCCGLIVEHASFTETGYGSEIPIFPPTEILFRKQDPRMCCYGHECQACKQEDRG